MGKHLQEWVSSPLTKQFIEVDHDKQEFQEGALTALKTGAREIWCLTSHPILLLLLLICLVKLLVTFLNITQQGLYSHDYGTIVAVHELLNEHDWEGLEGLLSSDILQVFRWDN